MDLTALVEYIEEQAHNDPNLERVYYRGYWKGVFQTLGASAIACVLVTILWRLFR